MDSTQVNVENVTMSEVLELATWNIERSDEELDAFITRREQAVASK
jgi:hypothetical protein